MPKLFARCLHCDAHRRVIANGRKPRLLLVGRGDPFRDGLGSDRLPVEVGVQILLEVEAVAFGPSDLDEGEVGPAEHCRAPVVLALPALVHRRVAAAVHDGANLLGLRLLRALLKSDKH